MAPWKIFSGASARGVPVARKSSRAVSAAKNRSVSGDQDCSGALCHAGVPLACDSAQSKRSPMWARISPELRESGPGRKSLKPMGVSRRTFAAR